MENSIALGDHALRILMGVHGLPPASIGGTELAALRLARALAGRHEVVLFHPLSEPGLPAGSERRRVDQGVLCVGRVLPPPSRFEETWRLPEAESWFRSLLARHRPDVCHLHHLTGLSLRLPVIAREAGVPSILTLHDYWTVCARGQRMDLALEVCPGPTPRGCATCLSDQLLLERPVGRVIQSVLARVRLPARWIELGKQASQRIDPGPDPSAQAAAHARIDAARAALEAATRLTGPSRDIAAAMQSLVPGLRPIEVVVNGFAPRASIRPEPPPLPPAGPLRVAFLGAMIPTKGPHLLLEAVEGLSALKVELAMMGPSPVFHRQPGYAQALRERAGRLDVRIEPPCAPEAVPGWLRRQHVLVLPSIWPENAPLVVGEAFREGVPVVASRIGGIPELVTDGVNGRLVPPGDVRALEAVLRSLATDPAEVIRLGEGAWSTPLPELESQVRRWEALYEALAGPPGSSDRGGPAEG